MTISNKNLNLILIILFFIFIFWVCIVPLRDVDIWFHIKSGEVITQQGLIFHDVFSYTALGREWIPYEWVFQVAMFWVQQTFGFEFIKYVAAFVVTIQTIFIFLILRKIFKVNLWLAFFIIFCFISFQHEFQTARPHAWAYALFIISLFLILNYFRENEETRSPYFKSKDTKVFSLTSAKKLLLINIPLTILWANLHGSVFLNIALFLGYSFISLIYYFVEKEKSFLIKTKVLALFGIITFLCTILPPLGFSQYRLLYKFFGYRHVLTNFIEEWTPLNANPYAFIYVSAIAGTILLLTLLTLWRKRSWKDFLILVPLLPFPFLTYTAVRNAPLSAISFAVILGWNLAQINFNGLSKWRRWILISIFIALFIGSAYILYLKKIPERLYYPVNATRFIKEYKLQGNMFNEYGYGGYLLYHLYPDQKVFYDGRTEMYLCCEMPDTLKLSEDKYLPDEKYKNTLNWLWDKHKISYALIRPQKHSVLRKMARILTDDPQWGLVFWDDYTQIFVRLDGKNDQLVKDLGVKAATPYNQNPFRENMEDQAFEEYQRMIKVVDSSKSRNAIGFIMLKKGQFPQAALEFQKAILIDPTNESPYMNLAELAAKDKNYPQAIELYEQALKLAPDRGLIYIRLGQLYIQIGGDFEKAKDIWQKGVENTVDEDAKKKLQELLTK